MVEISIIIPVYNAEKYLEKCINSILNQTIKNYEIILIDDGSTDNSRLICDNIAKENKNIMVIHQKNKGVSEARNEGLRLAKAEYVAFIDADDWLEENYLEKILTVINTKIYDIIVIGYNEIFKDRSILKIDNKQNNNFVDLILDVKNNTLGYLFNKIIRKSIIKEMFKENIAKKEDLLFLLQNWNVRYKYYVIYDGLYNYRYLENSLSHSKKYNIKSINSLEVDRFIYRNCDSVYNIQYIYFFIYEYLEYFFNSNASEKVYIMDKYEKDFKTCIRTYLFNGNILLKAKIIVKYCIYCLKRRMVNET